MSKLRFSTLDVFTHTRFGGNPLAIVHVPSGSQLTYEQKLSIAREFNLSETVFLYEPASAATTTEAEPEIEISIFTTTTELPFAGHPTVGTGFYILSGMAGIFTAAAAAPSRIRLRTLSGVIPVHFDCKNYQTRLLVTHNVKVHPSFDCTALKAQQPQLAAADFVNGLGGAEPVCSIVKGMNFFLFEFTSVDALARLQQFPGRVALPEGYLGDYDGLLGVYSYVRLGTSTSADGTVMTMKLQARMFLGLVEDPATGSAASAMGSYLALTTAGRARVRVFEITQGVEMGRRSEIRVKVVLTEDGVVEEVELGGGAVGVMEGVLTL